MYNKYNFLSGDYVIEFDSPLPLETTYRWFSKNCFHKKHISYEFAVGETPNIEQDKINFTFEQFSSIDEVIKRIPSDMKINAVALHDSPAKDIYAFINVIKSMYKIRKQYWVF